MVCDASERRLNSSAKMCRRYEEAVTQTTSLLLCGGFRRSGQLFRHIIGRILSASSKCASGVSDLEDLLGFCDLV
jgi:hypothetical protein